jgi:hypothetical protein
MLASLFSSTNFVNNVDFTSLGDVKIHRSAVKNISSKDTNPRYAQTLSNVGLTLEENCKAIYISGQCFANNTSKHLFLVDSYRRKISVVPATTAGQSTSFNLFLPIGGNQKIYIMQSSVSQNAFFSCLVLQFLEV